MYRVIGSTESFLTIFARVVAKEKGEALRQETFAWALSWLEEEGASSYTGNNRLVHIIFYSTPTDLSLIESTERHASSIQPHRYSFREYDVALLRQETSK